MQVRTLYVVGERLDLLGFPKGVDQAAIENTFPSDGILDTFFTEEDAKKYADSFVNAIDLSVVKPIFTLIMSAERVTNTKSSWVKCFEGKNEAEDLKTLWIHRSSINLVKSVRIHAVDRTSELNFHPQLMANLNDMVAGKKPKFQYKGVVYQLNKKPYQLGLAKATEPYERVWQETKGSPVEKTRAVLKSYRYWFFAPWRNHRAEAAGMLEQIKRDKIDNFQIFPFIQGKLKAPRDAKIDILKDDFGAVLRTLMHKTAPESLTLEFLETVFKVKEMADLVLGYAGCDLPRVIPSR